MERRPGTPLVLTDEQAASLEKDVAQRTDALAAPIEADREAPPKGGDGSPGPYGNVGGYNNFWLDPGTRYTSVDGQKRASLIIDPPDGRVPALTPEAQKRRTAAATMQRGRPPTRPRAKTIPGSKGRTRTTTPSSVRSASAASSDSVRRRVRRCFRPTSTTTCIRSCRRRDYVMILTEMVHDARIIRMNAQHCAADHPQVDGRFGRPLGRRHAGRRDDELHRQDALPGIEREPASVIERFTRVDAKTLRYQFTIEDPTTWTKPWTGEYTWPITDEQHLRVRVPRGQLRDGEHPARRAAEGNGRSGEEDQTVDQIAEFRFQSSEFGVADARSGSDAHRRVLAGVRVAGSAPRSGAARGRSGQGVVISSHSGRASGSAGHLRRRHADARSSERADQPLVLTDEEAAKLEKAGGGT